MRKTQLIVNKTQETKTREKQFILRSKNTWNHNNNTKQKKKTSNKDEHKNDALRKTTRQGRTTAINTHTHTHSHNNNTTKTEPTQFTTTTATRQKQGRKTTQ